MAKSRFRIIALKPITPEGQDKDTIARVKSIQKKVFGEDWLYFFDGYKLTDMPDGLAGDDDMQPFYRKEDKQAAIDNMQRLDILSLQNKSFCELSGGQQQRVLLARALCAAQDMLLMDEPVKGFDPKITQLMYDDIAALNRSGMTVIMISHDLAAARQYATKTLHLTRDRSVS